MEKFTKLKERFEISISKEERIRMVWIKLYLLKNSSIKKICYESNRIKWREIKRLRRILEEGEWS
jgi:hypothetical protein